MSPRLKELFIPLKCRVRKNCFQENRSKTDLPKQKKRGLEATLLLQLLTTLHSQIKSSLLVTGDLLLFVPLSAIQKMKGTVRTDSFSLFGCL
ncbi:hypothetical protein CDAR_486921, partial [Caerostris darwini]